MKRSREKVHFRRILLLLSTLGVFLGVIILTQAQVNNALTKTKSAKSLEKGLNLSYQIDYQSIAKFKAFSRKNEYRIGELISIDIAMLNKSKESIYFLDLGRWARISVKDSNDNDIEAGNYIHPLLGPKFNLVGNGNYDSSHFLYLIGCDDIYKNDNYSHKNMEDDFNNNHFVNLGSGCIKINKPGTYIIKAKISNTFTENDKTIKTAMGTIESTPFEIKIIE